MNHPATHLRVVLGALLVLVAALAVLQIDRGSTREEDAVRYDADGRATRPLRLPSGRPNLIVLVVDTLRADALEGGEDSVMPGLARLAREGLSFPDASATAPWTLPSVGSLLTGSLPSVHGLLDMRRPPSLPAAVTTYAEVLSRSLGYDTAAYVDAPWFAGPSAMLQGFQASGMGFHLQGIDTFVGPWAARRDPTRPFFLFLHTNEAHAPYGASNHAWPTPPNGRGGVPLPERLEPWEATRIAFLDVRRRDALARVLGPAFSGSVVRYIGDGYAEEPRPELAAELRSAYEEGLRWVDGVIGRALGRLGGLGLLENTLLVVTGDHGEAFGEHGHLGHGRQMYDELLRVPLVMRGPAPFEGGRIARGSVSVMDVMPTFLDWIGAPPIADTQGVSLLPVVRGESRGRPVLAEEELSPENMQRPADACVASMRNERWKYVVTQDREIGSVREELYDLAVDPGETVNLLAAGAGVPDLPPDVCGAIRSLRAHVASRAREKEDLGRKAGSEPVALAHVPCD